VATRKNEVRGAGIEARGEWAGFDLVHPYETPYPNSNPAVFVKEIRRNDRNI
jgi:hypothetical protein